MEFSRNELDQSVVDRFRRIARTHRRRLAVEGRHRDWTYAELDEVSDRIASYILDRLGTGQEPIGLAFEQTDDGVFGAQLGVLKSGKFYFHIDDDLSEKKVAALLSDARPQLILHGDGKAEFLGDVFRQHPSIGMVHVGYGFEESGSEHRVLQGPAASDYAYIVFTSGSTGQPVGVVVSHRNVMHFSMTATNSLHISKKDRVSQICPLTSAASSAEIFPTLLNGAVLCPFSVKQFGVTRLASWLNSKEITLFTAVPALFRLVSNVALVSGRVEHVRFVRLSGDRVLATDLEAFKQCFSTGASMRVALGAAEVLLFAHNFLTHESKVEGEVVPVGFPIEDMQVFIEDDSGNRLPPGRIGEIVVKSNYLSVGYWRNSYLTASRFRPSEDGDVGRIYETRDLGYIDSEGCLHHVGRKDERVKMHGRMISMVEIERCMLRIEGIEDAVVAPYDDETGAIALAAYYVCNTGTEISAKFIRVFLRNCEGIEFLPKHYIRLESMPRTARLKTDRRKLAEQLRYEVPMQSSTGDTNNE